MVVNGNGESEIVCLWLTQFEDKETITKLVEEFKKYNSDWISTKCDVLWLIERTVHSLSFWFAYFGLAYRLEIIIVENGVCKRRELKNGPQRLVEYFENNWHSIRHEWVDGLKIATCNTMNRTIEIKESVSYSRCDEVFEHSENWRDHRALEIVMKRRVLLHDSDTSFGCLFWHFEFVKDQLENYNKLRSQGRSITTTIDSCPAYLCSTHIPVYLCAQVIVSDCDVESEISTLEPARAVQQKYRTSFNILYFWSPAINSASLGERQKGCRWEAAKIHQYTLLLKSCNK